MLADHLADAVAERQASAEGALDPIGERPCDRQQEGGHDTAAEQQAEAARDRQRPDQIGAADIEDREYRPDIGDQPAASIQRAHDVIALGMRAAAQPLGDQLAVAEDEAKPVETIRGLTALDDDRAKAFTSAVLKLSTKAPPVMSRQINQLATQLLKKKSVKRWKAALETCWGELMAVKNSMSAIEARLDTLDTKKKVALLQKLGVLSATSKTAVEENLSEALEKAELRRRKNK